MLVIAGDRTYAGTGDVRAAEDSEKISRNRDILRSVFLLAEDLTT